MCEHYISHGICESFPDWTIGPVGLLKIGYDYARSVTGFEQAMEPDLVEEDVVDQVVPDSHKDTMVATTSEVQLLFFETTCNYYFCIECQSITSVSQSVLMLTLSRLAL